MSNNTIHCEYCGMDFTDRYLAQHDKSKHKARCPKKRYLGGTLTTETYATAGEALRLDGER